MKANQLPKPKTTFQNQLNFLQTMTKHPFRSKTPPNLLQNNIKTYVNTTVNYDDESDEIDRNGDFFQSITGENTKETKLKQHIECNSNSSRRITSQNPKKDLNRKKKDDVLRFSLENNKNLAWNDIAKLLNNTNKKEIKTKPNEPKCLNNNQTFKPKGEQNTYNLHQTINKYQILRKSLNQKADNYQDLENIPVIHENFENLVNNYVNNQKNTVQRQQNIRHSCEGLPLERNKPMKNAQISIDNERIKIINGNFSFFM